MKIAILSDVHDHWGNLGTFLEDVKEKQIEHIIHLGDYGAAGLCVKPLLSCGIPVTGIRGNNDGEKRAITKLFEKAEDCEILGKVYGEVVLDGRKIFMIHYHDLHNTIAKSGDYDLVLYGHDHTINLETRGNIIVCNPGAICGNKESASYAIYDTKQHSIHHVKIDHNKDI